MNDITKNLRACAAAGAATDMATPQWKALAIAMLRDAADTIDSLRRLAGVVSDMEKDFKTITKDIKRSAVEPQVKS